MDYILNLIYYPLAMLLKLCYMLCNDYGLSIILFAVIARLFLLPIGIKSEKSRRKLQKYQPKINALQAKYKGDTKNPKYNEELQKLYSEEGYNPMSGCLPALIQLPIIMGLWNAIRKPLTYIFDFTNGNLEKIYNLVKAAGGLTDVTSFAQVQNNQMSLINAINMYHDRLVGFLPENFPEHVNMTFLGLNLGDTPRLAFEWSILLPIVSALTSFLVGYLTQKINKRVDGSAAAAAAPGAQNMNFMLYTMPLISLVMAFSFQNGVGIYWITSNLLSIAQVFIIPLFVKEPKEAVKVKEKKLNYNQIEKLEREKALAEENAKPEEAPDPNKRVRKKPGQDKNTAAEASSESSDNAENDKPENGQPDDGQD